MMCVIYKSHRKSDHYLYVEKADDFSRVPEALLDRLQQLEWVMELELTPDRKLAQADVQSVKTQLLAQGFYLQVPPPHYTLLAPVS